MLSTKRERISSLMSPSISLKEENATYKYIIGFVESCRRTLQESCNKNICTSYFYHHICHQLTNNWTSQVTQLFINFREKQSLTLHYSKLISIPSISCLLMHLRSLARTKAAMYGPVMSNLSNNEHTQISRKSQN